MGLKDYTAGWQRYQELAKRGALGDTAAQKDKVKVREELRQMERQGARDGVILESGHDVTEQVTIENHGNEPRPKRDLQKEYVAKFSGDEVLMPQKARGEPEKTNLRKWHRRRLGI